MPSPDAASAVGGLELIDAPAVEAVAAEMRADSAAPEPARGEGAAASRRAARVRTPDEPAPCPQRAGRRSPIEQRIAALEARAEEHEAMLRRVLVLLVDWVEAGQDNAYRTHAA